MYATITNSISSGSLISQNLSEFALHVRAVLGLPIPLIEQLGPAASAVILGEGSTDQIAFEGAVEALSVPGTDLRLFGKPSMDGHRRLGVALARSEDLAQARAAAAQAASCVRIISGREGIPER